MYRLCFLTGLLLLLITSCAGIPTVSTPQVISTVERSEPSNLAKPTPDMTPEAVLREFLKATADPTNRHLAARQFLTPKASAAWDDAGSALLIGNVNFHTTPSGDHIFVTMKADILGSLSEMGVFETASGTLSEKDPIELVNTDEGWRIDQLANGVFLDWQQFQAIYKRHTLYFVDPTGKTVVPDPRYIAVADPNQLATELVLKLISGPRPEIADGVRNLLGTPVRLRGPVTRADGGQNGVGRGYGGTRIDLDGVDTNDPHTRQLLAAQLIWTFVRSDVKGPYFIDADGVAFDDRFVDGWTTADVVATDPGAYEGSGAGLHALVSGAIVGLNNDKTVHISGAFGREVNQVASALSWDGRQAASVVIRQEDANSQASLWIGDLGGEAIQVAEGHHLTRPSWAIDNAVWEVINGTTVIRALEEGTTGRPVQIPVDSAAVSSQFPGQISELQLSRDGTRVAMVIAGQVILASVEQNNSGQFSLVYPRKLGYGLGDSVVSLSWVTGDDLIVSCNSTEHPVSYVNIDGVNSDTPAVGLTRPVTIIAATPSTAYVAGPQGILQLSLSTPKEQQRWQVIPAFASPGIIPVLPG